MLHNKDWLRSTKTNPQGRAVKLFAVNNDLANCLYQFIRLMPNNPPISAYLECSDHNTLMSVFASADVLSSEIKLLLQVSHYNSPSWDGLGNFFLLSLGDQSAFHPQHFCYLSGNHQSNSNRY